MKSTVYFASAKGKGNLVKQTALLYDRVGEGKIFSPDGLVAIKLSFSEFGNTCYIRPVFVRQIVEKVKDNGAKPFLTDANTLYVGGRSNSVDHIQTAIKNGFAYSTVNAPIIIADGLKGKDYVEVEINQRYCKTAKIGTAIFHADGLISMAHTHGHGGTGMASTFKNIGMGLGSRAGKQAMHSQDEPPRVTRSKCIGCGECTLWCPVNAISLKNQKARINSAVCIRCGECTVTCPVRAIAIRWEDPTSRLQERIVEYTYAVLQNKLDKSIFFSFIIDVCPGCLCERRSGTPIIPDVGVLASHDPVAIEQASYDLVNNQPGLPETELKGAFRRGQDKFRNIYPEVDTRITMEYAESIGLGSRDYRIVEI